jgi:AcrR family transcriptional regulator
MPRIRNSHPVRAAQPENSARKKPVQARSKTMVEMIMRAAARILVRDGYEALTTNLVAEEAGASVGSLYQYFSSKQQLVTALLERHIDDTMSQLREELPHLSLLPVEQAIPRFVELMIASHRVDPALHRVFFEQLPRVGDYAKIETSLNEGLMLAEAYLRAHAADVQPQNHALSAFMLVHSIEALTHAAVLSRPDWLATPEFVAEISALILGYLRPRTPATSPSSSPSSSLG